MEPSSDLLDVEKWTVLTVVVPFTGCNRAYSYKHTKGKSKLGPELELPFESHFSHWKEISTGMRIRVKKRRQKLWRFPNGLPRQREAETNPFRNLR